MQVLTEIRAILLKTRSQQKILSTSVLAKSVCRKLISLFDTVIYVAVNIYATRCCSCRHSIDRFWVNCFH